MSRPARTNPRWEAGSCRRAKAFGPRATAAAISDPHRSEPRGDVVKILSGKSVSVLALLMAGAGVLGTTVLAQTPGPFTAAQADAGRAAYAANCISCHQANLAGEGDALPLAGKTFIAAWRNRSTADLYNTIRTSMPYGNPGSLDAATYANLVAFILQANGATPGSTAFTPATAVKISTVASGTVPADIQRGVRPAQATAARPGARIGAAPPSPDNGAGMIRSFGQTMVGDIKTYTPVTEAMLTHPPEGEWLTGR